MQVVSQIYILLQNVFKDPGRSLGSLRFSVALHKQSHACVQNVRKKKSEITTKLEFTRCFFKHNFPRYSTLEARIKTFIFTHEVDTVGPRHRDSGPGDRPDPRPACPSADWGGSCRTPPSQVWGYTLGTAALRKNKPQD